MGLRKSFRPTNLVVNGDFSNSDTGWAHGYSTVAVASNTVSVIGTGSGASPTIYRPIASPAIASNKYFVRCTVRVTNDACAGLYFGLQPTVAGSNTSVPQLTPTQDQWYVMSGVLTASADSAGDMRIRCYHNYADAATANTKVMELKEVLVFDCNAQLPADIFALSDANLKIWCNANIPAWFNGTICGGQLGGM